MGEIRKMADFHQDTINPYLAEILNRPELNHAAERKSQIPREGLRELDIIFASIYRRMTTVEKAAALSGDESIIKKVRIDELKLLEYYRTSKYFKIITKPEDLRLEGHSDTNQIILHKEGGDIISAPDIVDDLHARGVRSIGLLYSHDNQLGGGADGDKERGLTTLGKQVVDRMLKMGMIIDIAHANRKTAHDILERVGEYDKAVATHTAIGDSERLITKELLQKIAAKGGVVGFTPISAFFPDFETFIDKLREASDITGSAKNLAIGTDFGGVDAKYLFSQLDEVGKLAIIAEKLSEQGNFSDEQIADIMYGNIERIVKKL